PTLHHHLGNEAGGVGAARGCAGATSLDLVGEEQEQEVLDRHRVLLGERESLGERVEELAQAELLHRAAKLGSDDGRAHHAPPLDGFVIVANAEGSRAKRPGDSEITLPAARPSDSICVALFSMRSMRGTSMTSKASARAQSALTRSLP